MIFALCEARGQPARRLPTESLHQQWLHDAGLPIERCSGFALAIGMVEPAARQRGQKAVAAQQ